MAEFRYLTTAEELRLVQSERVLIGEPWVDGKGHDAVIWHRYQCSSCDGVGSVELVSGHPNNPYAKRHEAGCDDCDGKGERVTDSCSCLRCRELGERIVLEAAWDDIKDELEAARVTG